MDIYNEIHSAEESGRAVIGWQRSIYPTEATAREALEKGELYVLEEDGRILASAKINQKQEEAYAEILWEHPAPEDRVMVLHTLTVSPDATCRGLGSRFVTFYEDLSRRAGCICLRMDTNEKNLTARRLYKKLGYREAGVVNCVFNDLPNVRLVCLEKKL